MKTTLLSFLFFFPCLVMATDFENVELINCYDGDTCKVNLQEDFPEIFSKNLSIRIRGIDAPEIRGKCEREKKLAKAAKIYLNEQMKSATRIELRNVERGKYFRVVADVYVDGQSVAELLLKNNLVVPYEEEIDWCES